MPHHQTLTICQQDCPIRLHTLPTYKKWVSTQITSLFVFWRVCRGPMTLLFAWLLCFDFLFILFPPFCLTIGVHLYLRSSQFIWTHATTLATLAVKRFFVSQTVLYFHLFNSFYRKHNLHGYYLYSLYCFVSYLYL